MPPPTLAVVTPAVDLVATRVTIQVIDRAFSRLRKAPLRSESAMQMEAPMHSQPFMPIQEIGLLELVGINEQIDSGDFSGSVSYTFTTSNLASGELLSFAFFATEDGSGAVLPSAGYLLIFDADPNPTSGDTALTAAEWLTLIGKVEIKATDWITDANGGLAFIHDVPIPFHGVSTLYFVWMHNDATAINSAAGDDEQLELNAWFMRHS